MRREVLVVLLLLGASVPLALSAQGPLRALVADRLTGAALPAPPTLQLLSPQDGDGVTASVALAGEARSDRGRVTDVQYRVDGARWSSVPDAPRGERATAFRVPLRLEPGDHVLEVRATDGDAWSLPSRVVVRAGEVAPPTVRILSPRDGEGVPAGELEVLGTVASAGPWRVLVRAGGEEQEARIVGDSGNAGTWRATVPVGEGPLLLSARAIGLGGEGLPRVVHLAANATAPPTLTILRPDARSSFGSAGSDDCPSTCVLFAGVAAGPDGVADVLAALDEAAPLSLAGQGGLVSDGPGAAWSWRLPVDDLYSGPHVARFTPVSPDGKQGVPREVEFALRTPRALLVDGDDAPRLTLTPLAFSLTGNEDARARWTLDGTPLGEAGRVVVNLTRPGDHLLAVQSPDAEGRQRVARVPLFALNRAPTLPLVESAPATAATPALLVAHAQDPDGAVARYLWDFGDGATLATTAPETTHAFPHGGAFTVKVVAVDDAGASSLPGVLVVPVANAQPLASFRWSPRLPTTLEDVRFEDQSRDPENRLVSWRWDFGDGAGSSERSPAHRFATRGPRVVTLSVADAQGGVAVASATVDVQNVPPAPAFRATPALPATGQEVVFTDATTKLDGALVSWRWDFGDGAAANGSTARHAYGRPGSYAVTLRVTDDWGAVASLATTLDVADAAPLVERIVVEPALPTAAQAVTFRAVAADLDGEVVTLSWDFGDGGRAEGFEVKHAYNKSGTYDVLAVALDAKGQRGVLNLTLKVRNAVPLVTLRLVDGAYAGYPTLLEADAVDPDGNVTRYAFDVDGDGRAECDGPSPSCLWTLALPGHVVARVKATDDEGGVGEAALPLDVRAAPGGVKAPVVRILAPTPGAVLKGEVLVQGTATGAASLQAIDVQLREENASLATPRGGWQRARGTDAWSLLLDTRGAPDGGYLLAVRATDAAGATNETAVRVAVENGKPSLDVTLRVLTLAPGQTVQDDLVVRGTAYHPEGVTSVRWSLDNAAWRTAEGLPVSWSVPLQVRDLPPGPHVLRVEARRGLGAPALAEVPFTVPDLRPALTVTEPPSPTLYAKLRMEGASTPNARVAWRIDAGLWRDAPVGEGRWRVDASTDDVAPGPHVVSVKPIDDRTGLQGETLQFHVRILNPKVREAAVQTASPTAPRETPLGMLALPALAAAAAALLAATQARRRQGR